MGDKVIGYTGDTEWTDKVARAAQNTDLLIAECYVYDAGRVGARRLILTHMSREMLARAADVPEQCAYDGLVVTR